MKRFVYLLLCLLFYADLPAQETIPITKIACVGNSITFGHGIHNRDRDSYPAILGQMLGSGYEVRNFGVSGRTMLNKGDYPYMRERMFKEALNYQPDVVVIKLGTNDSKPHNWKYKNEYMKDMEIMINEFRKFSSRPDIYLCYPPKAYTTQPGIDDDVIVNEIIPFIDKVASRQGVKVIDLHTSTSGMSENFPDRIHPNEEGAIVLAETVYKGLTGDAKRYEKQSFPGSKSQWHGYDRYDFNYKNRQAIAVVPKKTAEGNPWIWRPAFFGAFPTVDVALLEKGFHVLYYDLTHLYGSPAAINLGTDFYKYMKDYYDLSSKVTLEGFSRGGLFVFNWASANTDKVACIYADAPVCDVFSWPGRRQQDLWSDFLKQWNLTEIDMDDFKGNPIDAAGAIAKAGIPVISVCGDSDKAVPYTENMEKVRNQLVQTGSPVEVILKKDVDHHPHSLEEPKVIVDFIIRNQPEYKSKQSISPRGSMKNSYLKFEKQHKGRVAFLGGSITAMKGWHNLVEEQLKQRFPATEFDFVHAGIPSTGSTPGAFRFKNDVLKDGKVDLLFVEAAVNDDTNGFSYIEQTRGMEGEVRQALLSNPDMDIVMLHFIYDPFIGMLNNNQLPDVILNHERVANHYAIPSINLAKEIVLRMRDKEFNWEQFGGTHPAPLGHDYYAAAIAVLFDCMWNGVRLEEKEEPHIIPARPLDVFSYFNGEFINIKEARLLSGWKHVDSWCPESKAGKRNGFVNVPMIETKKAGSKLSLEFEGKAIGLFCVCGPSAGIIEYSVDGSSYKKLDTFTAWSKDLYIPWVYMLETELSPGKHKLVIRMSNDKNKSSTGHELQIRNFVVNR